MSTVFRDDIGEAREVSRSSRSSAATKTLGTARYHQETPARLTSTARFALNYIDPASQASRPPEWHARRRD